MKRSAKQRSDGNTDTDSRTQAQAAHFIGVRDSRNRKVPGLYVRNGRFYVQLWVSRDDGSKTARKFPLLNGEGESVSNLVEAKEEGDLALGRRFAVRTVDRVLADRLGEQFPDGAVSGLRRVGRAHDFAMMRDSVLAFENLQHDRA